MILAEQHRPGGWKSKTDPYTPVCAWPEDCYVQWGSRGIVLCREDPNYETAFFEAFPRDPNTFIRGEGASLAEAEAKAFASLERYRACPGHEFERRGYRNGGGFCRHCHMFQSGVFEPLEHCSVCGRATYYSYREKVWYCEEHTPPCEPVDDGDFAAALAEITQRVAGSSSPEESPR